MIIEQKISLDFYRQTMPVVVYAKQFDADTRVVRISPFANGVSYTIPEGVVAHFSCKKADGKAVMYPVPIVDGEIVVTLSKQTLACEGKAVADVFFVKDGKTLSSQNFIIRVGEAPIQDDDVVESAEELTSLKNAIAEAGNAQETATEALEKAQEAVDLIGDANSLNARMTVVERKIENIDSALEGDVYADAVLSGVGYEIELPANALPWMHTDRIGCASSRNFESILDFSTITPQTQNGITVSCNAESGVFTINGTATANVYIQFEDSFGTSGSKANKVVRLEKVGGTMSGVGVGDCIGIANANADGVGQMRLIDDSAEKAWVSSEMQRENEIGYIYIVASPGATFVNCKFYVGVANAENAWSLVENKPTALRVMSKNLLGFSGELGTIQAEGVVSSYDKETGIFTLNGKVTALGNIPFLLKDAPKISANQNYTLSVEYVGGSLTVPSGKYAVAYLGRAINGKDTNWIAVNLLTQNSARTVTNDIDTTLAFWFYVTADVSFDNYQCRIQFERGDTATAYTKPSATISTTALPNLDDLDGWGQGVPSVGGNYIAFADDGRVLYHRTSERIVFDGNTEKWYWEEKDGKVSHFYTSVGTTPIVFNKVGSATAVCSDYDVVDSIFNYVGKSCCSLLANSSGSCTVYLRDTAFTDKTREEWVNYVKARAESGNPIVIEYALATPPDSIDITDRFDGFDGFIEGQGNGSIIIENEHKAALPIQLTYEEVLG